MALRFGRRAPASTTPVLDQTRGSSFVWTLIKTVTFPLIPIVLLVWLGQPGLRIQAWYHGSKAAPIYTRCQYLTLTGWRDFAPYPGINQCPAVRAFPFSLDDLTGGL